MLRLCKVMQILEFKIQSQACHSRKDFNLSYNDLVSNIHRFYDLREQFYKKNCI